MRLDTLPLAYGVIPEAAELGIAFRQKLFGHYRIIYRIDGDRVTIVRVIHCAQLLDLSVFFR